MMHTHRAQKVRKRRFLEAMARVGTIHGASRETGIHRSVHYEWMKDPEYAAAFAEAEEAAIDAMEAEARRRAVEGVTRPVYQGGRHVGDITEYSDQLLMFYLKGKRPMTWSEKARVELSGPNGGPVEFVQGIDDHEKRLLRDAIQRELREREAASADGVAAVDATPS